MNVRIGVAESSKVVEVEIDELESFQKMVESAVGAGEIAWFVDTKGHTVGIPSERIAYVEVESGDNAPKVGFAAL